MRVGTAATISPSILLSGGYLDVPVIAVVSLKLRRVSGIVNGRLTKRAQDFNREHGRMRKTMQHLSSVPLRQCLVIGSNDEDRQKLARLLMAYGFELAIAEDAEQ